MKILLAYDGSELSEKAKDYAAKMGGGNEITVLSVDDTRVTHPLGPADYSSALGQDTVKKMEEKKMKAFQEAAEKATADLKDKGINAAPRVERGHAAQTICKIAREGNYDMIVMGNRGLGGVKQLLLGSVSNHVVQCTEKTVVIVK